MERLNGMGRLQLPVWQRGRAESESDLDDTLRQLWVFRHVQPDPNEQQILLQQWNTASRTLRLSERVLGHVL